MIWLDDYVPTTLHLADYLHLAFFMEPWVSGITYVLSTCDSYTIYGRKDCINSWNWNTLAPWRSLDKVKAKSCGIALQSFLLCLDAVGTKAVLSSFDLRSIASKLWSTWANSCVSNLDRYLYRRHTPCGPPLYTKYHYLAVIRQLCCHTLLYTLLISADELAGRGQSTCLSATSNHLRVIQSLFHL